jgi:DNA-binding GntR family transcriptional regulator
MEMSANIRKSIQRLQQRSLVLEVRDELERMILLGEVAQGERLNEISLAKKLGVSRGPVREAARSLEREGLVMTVANQGVYVRKLSVEDALELYDLRAMIAGHLCAAAAIAASSEAKAKMRTFVLQMEDSIKTGDEQAYFTLNLDFHDCVAAASGSLRATALYGSLGKEVRLMRLRVLSGESALRRSNIEHDQIVTAIENGDVETARSAGAQHHLNGKKRLLETL